ncbi:MAG: pyrroline-5-carboxylate reductase [Planctomycetaceae bacterium]
MAEQVSCIGFLGAGKMATALAAGLVQRGFATCDGIVAADISPAAGVAFEQMTGGRLALSNQDVLAQARIVVLAVKPQVAQQVVQSLEQQLTTEHLLISIVAGTTIAQLTEWSGGRCRIVRVMPNTPALVGAGASGFAGAESVSEADRDLVRSLLETVGIAIEVPERLLDAVTGLSGSGPAYAFAMIEALSDGGVRMGLPRAAATQLAAQTLLGAARMVLESGEHPGSLKDAVTSPGGTTIAGLHALERGGLRGVLMNTVEAATLRSQELGRT